MKNKKIANTMNSVMTKQFLFLVALILVLVGAERLGAVTTWSDPTQDPPGGSIVAPVTVGVSSTTVQVVQGKISMDLLGVFGSGFIQDILSVGTSVAPTDPDINLLVDGGVGAKKYCNETGGDCFEAVDVVNMLNDTDDGITCSQNPDYSSMNGGPDDTYFNMPEFGESGYFGASSLGSVFGATANENRWDIVTVPASCKEDAGCVIRQKIYRRYTDPFFGSGWYEDRLYAVRDTEFHQEASPTGTTAEQLWSSSYSTGGGAKNGDTKSSNVIKPFSYLYLRDDANVTGGETDNDKFSAYDYTRSYGFEIYFCSEAVI